IDRGAHYVWYHSYRPVGPKMTTELALRPDQLVRIRKFIVRMRAKMPIAIVDAYYDHNGQALCPMATGISHHISPRGEIEPCPVIQFAVENIRDSRGVFQTMRDSAFLQDFRDAAAQSTRGCIVLERPDLIQQLVLKHGARDTTVRGTARAELAAMQPRSSQHLPGEEVPEEHWMYRFAKRYWFNDFGAYRKAGDGLNGKPPAEPKQVSTGPMAPPIMAPIGVTDRK
ncbi:MAG: radical SAM protein, partial [Limisphaerales bacterium]